MKLPRVLVILVVVLVILQVASCGLPALNLGGDVSPERLGELLDDVTPDPPAVDPADVTTCDAAVSSGPVVFTGVCRIVIEAASGSVRRLTLRDTGPGTVEMRMSAPATAERDLPDGEDEHVDVPPDERAELDLFVSCRLPRPVGCGWEAREDPSRSGRRMTHSTIHRWPALSAATIPGSAASHRRAG